MHFGTNYNDPLPFPPDAPKVEISGNAGEIFKRRYMRDGETPEQAVWRVASYVAMANSGNRDTAISKAVVYYEFLRQFIFVPNSPTWSGAGTPLGQLAACFVLPLEDDLGKEDDGIFSTLRNAVLIQQRSGGNGFSFSKLRPKGSLVATSNGEASGPVSFIKAFDSAFGSIAQGGIRRGANMAVLRIDHPDIEEFITAKHKEGDIANFNISVAITDLFFKVLGESEREADEIIVTLKNGEIVTIKPDEVVEVDGEMITGSELASRLT
jgi:ribonucleoside-diphosphate reductase alpha chain